MILLLQVEKNIETINSRVLKPKNDKTMILSKCSICGSKKSKFIKKQEEYGTLSDLGLGHH